MNDSYYKKKYLKYKTKYIQEGGETKQAIIRGAQWFLIGKIPIKKFFDQYINYIDDKNSSLKTNNLYISKEHIMPPSQNLEEFKKDFELDVNQLYDKNSIRLIKTLYNFSDLMGIINKEDRILIMYNEKLISFIFNENEYNDFKSIYFTSENFNEKKDQSQVGGGFFDFFGTNNNNKESDSLLANGFNIYKVTDRNGKKKLENNMIIQNNTPILTLTNINYGVLTIVKISFGVTVYFTPNSTSRNANPKKITNPLFYIDNKKA